jgi:CubicO group peptidase (beta-lactamase class C family)
VPPFVEADGIRFAYPRFGKAGTGTRLLRRWRGEVHEVTVLGQGFAYHGCTYGTLSEIARVVTGTRWSGPTFFDLTKGRSR